MYNNFNGVYKCFINLKEDDKFLFILSNSDSRILSWLGNICRSYQIRDRRKWLTAGKYIMCNPLKLYYLEHSMWCSSGFSDHECLWCYSTSQHKICCILYQESKTYMWLSLLSDMGITKVSVVLTANGAIQIVSVWLTYVYIPGVILSAFMLLCTLCFYMHRVLCQKMTK